MSSILGAMVRRKRAGDDNGSQERIYGGDDNDDDASKQRRPSPSWTSRLQHLLYTSRQRSLLLPTHHSTSTTAKSTVDTAGTKSTTATAAAASNHNSYLFGGAYYPDKQQRRTQWKRQRHSHRMPTHWTIRYWIHSARVCVVPLVLLLLLVFYSGRRLRRNTDYRRSNSWLGQQYRRYTHVSSSRSSSSTVLVSSLSLPTLADERARAQQLEYDLQALEGLRQAKRRAILERIVPEWVHRNDQPTKEEESDHNKTTVKKAKKKKEPADDKNKKEQLAAIAVNTANTANTTRHVESPLRSLQNNQKPKHVDTDQRRLLRTIHNMDDPMFRNRTACQWQSQQPPSTTLVVQSSWDRLWILEETCRRWKDPIVAVVAEANDNEAQQVTATNWTVACPHMRLLLYRLDADQAARPELYPVNQLRNLALEQVQTSHVLVVDVDFVPSRGLHTMIQRALVTEQRQRYAQTAKAPPLAIVVPAFERNMDCNGQDCRRLMHENSSFIPETFVALTSCVDTKDCSVFQSGNNRDGHGSTRSEEWLQGKWYPSSSAGKKLANSSTSGLRRIDCFESLRYEPYVVIEWCPSAAAAVATDGQAYPVAPFYDERFHGYGKNKIQHVQHLRLLGYQFAVLPEGFLVHHPHAESQVKVTWNNRTSSDLHATMDALYPKFLHELVGLLENSNTKLNRTYDIVKQCHRPKKRNAG